MRLLTFTKKGYALGQSIKDHYPEAKLYGMKRDTKHEDEHYLPSVKSIVKYGMYVNETIVFIASTGIATRYIHEFIRHKSVDSAIIVVNDSGEFVIPLLSGHLGNANEIARDIAERLGAVCVITTASDHTEYTAIDQLATSKGYRIDDYPLAKDLTAKLIHGESVKVFGLDSLPKGYEAVAVKEEADIVLNKRSHVGQLVFRQPHYVLGIGCKRHYDSDKMQTFVKDTLAAKSIDLVSVQGIFSHDLKCDEEAIKALSSTLGVAFKTFSTEEMIPFEEFFKLSPLVKKTLGVGAVSEIVGYLGSHFGKCVLPRVTHDGMTLSIWEKLREN